MKPIRQLEDWWHIRRRDRKLAKAMRAADAVICFHAKSGSTWLRAMISHVYHQLYGTSPDLLIQYDNLKRFDRRVPFIYFGDGLEVRSWSGELLASVGPEKSVIILLRDPRDVAVSFHHHLRERATPRELLRKRVPDEVRRLDLFPFLLHREFGLPRVIERFNLWSEQARELPRSTFVTYEGLWRDTAGELGRVMAALGDEVPAPVLQAAVDFASFESLQQKERSGFFRGDRLKPVAVDGRQALKVRQGGTQGYRRLFTADQLAVIDAMVEDRLHPSLGYTAPADDRAEAR